MTVMVLGALSALAALAAARIGPTPGTTRVHYVRRAPRHTIRVPALTILFPAARGYAPGDWRAGCARGLGTCGTIRFIRGLKVTVAIRQLATGRSWNGRSFGSRRMLYSRARIFRQRRHGRRARLAAWYYQLALPGPVGGYTIRVRATVRRHRHARRLAQRVRTFAVQLSSAPPSPPTSTPPAGPPATFAIAGDAPGQLYPGGPSRSISLELTNPTADPIYVTSVSASLDSTGLPAGCSTTDFSLVPAVLPNGGLEIPAHGTVAMAGSGATPPSIQMANTSASQDACAGAHLTLSYTGSARS